MDSREEPPENGPNESLPGDPTLRVPPPPTSPVPVPVEFPEPMEPVTPVAPEPNLPEPAEPITVPPGPGPSAPPPSPQRPRDLRAWEERPEIVVEVPARRLAAQTRRDFLLFTAGVAATAAGAWWLLPDRARARLLPGQPNHRLDTLAARLGLGRDRRERLLDRALTFDDDVAEALSSKNRAVRTYSRSHVTPLRNRTVVVAVPCPIAGRSLSALMFRSITLFMSLAFPVMACSC